ncbi:MAG: Asp23/Gls24 family envelope stress response protein [Lachnospiraceae bacterium]|nr:Asp23/Gls24 family envelope stress response protein [Lachnospiraceae bacterium]
MENTELHTHKLQNEEKFGEVRIADEVVAIIAGLAASEVEGVASMAGNVTRDLIEKLGMKSLSKGVKITMEDDSVHVALAINIQYGFNVPATSSKIQEKVKTAIETMTGLEVAEVNIKIVNVLMEKD